MIEIGPNLTGLLGFIAWVSLFAVIVWRITR